MSVIHPSHSVATKALLVRSAEEEEAYYRRKSAIHECGHAIVARHYGESAYPAIWPNLGPNRENEKLWLGRVIVSIAGATRVQRRRIHLAGVVAEYMDHSDASSDLDDLVAEVEGIFYLDYADCWEHSDGWSFSDWNGARGWRERDIQAVVKILFGNWALLEREAEELISQWSKGPSGWQMSCDTSTSPRNSGELSFQV